MDWHLQEDGLVSLTFYPCFLTGRSISQPDPKRSACGFLPAFRLVSGLRETIQTFHWKHAGKWANISLWKQLTFSSFKLLPGSPEVSWFFDFNIFLIAVWIQIEDWTERKQGEGSFRAEASKARRCSFLLLYMYLFRILVTVRIIFDPGVRSLFVAHASMPEILWFNLCVCNLLMCVQFFRANTFDLALFFNRKPLERQ